MYVVYMYVPTQILLRLDMDKSIEIVSDNCFHYDALRKT